MEFLCICRAHIPGGLPYYQQFDKKNGHRNFLIALGTALAIYSHPGETEVFYLPQRRRTMTSVTPVVHRSPEYMNRFAMETDEPPATGRCSGELDSLPVQGQCESCLRIKKKGTIAHHVNRPRTGCHGCGDAHICETCFPLWNHDYPSPLLATPPLPYLTWEQYSDAVRKH